MDPIYQHFHAAYPNGHGYDLASSLEPEKWLDSPSFRRMPSEHNIKRVVREGLRGGRSGIRLENDEEDAWVEIYAAFWRAMNDLWVAEHEVSDNVKPAWIRVYNSWKEVTNAVIRAYSTGSLQAWTLPCLYIVASRTRVYAIKADKAAGSKPSEPSVNQQQTFGDDIANEDEANEFLEDAARQLNRIFQLCLSDRAPLEESRKWAIYNIINLLFKSYFKLNSISLSRNILCAIQAYRGDMPPLEAFPRSHQVTFKYYVGVIYFLEEDYAQAETNLTEAWRLCHSKATNNRELILTYLIPTKLLTQSRLPSRALLREHPRLATLFTPVCQAIKTGNLGAFDSALAANEAEFVRRRIYLTLERSREIAVRNLMRKVFVRGPMEPVKGEEGQSTRRTRVPLIEMAAALNMGRADGDVVDADEVECACAGLIYKNLMKGYIAREHGILVLSKKDAFPGTGV